MCERAKLEDVLEPCSVGSVCAFTADQIVSQSVEVRIGQSDLVTKDTMTGWLVSVQHTGLFGIVTGLGKARAKSLTPEQRRRIARAAAKARWKK